MGGLIGRSLYSSIEYFHTWLITVINMIPKIIHFTWFGTDPYPKLVKNCIDSWKQYLPDYDIKVWTSENFDININKWVSQAISVKMYAFAADFARVYLLYTYGGIYLDSDVQILHSLNPLLIYKAFTSFEPETLSTTDLEGEIMGSEPHHPVFKRLLKYYENRSFILPDGSYDTTIFPKILSKELFMGRMIEYNKEQDVDDIHILASGHFLWACHDVISNYSSDDAYSIHYAQYSWRNTDSIFSKVLDKSFDYYRIHEIRIWKRLKLLHIDKTAFFIYSRLRSWYLRMQRKKNPMH